MGAVIVKIRHVTWRDGKPRFIPGAALRAAGFFGQDLRHGDNGPWFSLAEAQTWSKALDRELADRRLAAATGRRPAKPKGRSGAYALANLFDDWLESPRFKGGVTTEGRRRRKPLARATVAFYIWNAKILKTFDENLYASPLAALTPQILDGLFDQLDEKHGAANARAVMATLRAALTFAVRRGKLGFNPAKGLGIGQSEARVRAGSIPEITAMLATADALELPEIGDMVLLAVVIGQRQADRLALEGGHLDDTGRMFFRQRKTGKIVRLLPIADLVARLAASRERRKAHTVQWPHVVINEARQRPLTKSTYAPLYRLVRKEAAKACPSVADLTDQDLRDTNQTWLINAGATDAQAAYVAGHDEATAARTRKHYVGRDPDQGDAAMEKLSAWLERKGAKL